MLYKNDEQVILNQKEISAVEKFFHNKFPVVVVYPRDRIVPSRLKHNRLPDKPNSIAFDLKSVVKEEGGASVWRYADDVLFDKNGNRKYIPKKFRYNGKRFLERKDMELIYFLLTKSEHRLISEEELAANKALTQSPRPKFMFEDLITEAEKKAEAKALESRISVLLYNKELGLPEERIRLVAKAYHIKDVDDMSLPQVKILLEGKIYDKKLGGPDKFFDMVNADEELEARANIQKLIDIKNIKYDEGKCAWFWNVEGDNGKTLITKVTKADIPVEKLYEMYRGDESFREDIKAVILSKGRKPPKRGKKDDENMDDE